MIHRSLIPQWTAREAALGLLFLGVLLFAAWAYWPGLTGTFLLDDFQNLKTLENIDEPVTLSRLAAFVATGLAGDLGRPLSLATFAAQYYAWPSDPWSFKYVNLLLHLLNGCLLFWLLWRTAALMGTPRVRAIGLGLIAASLWLLHPLQVSTTLYAVQRMTELGALFTLAGLLAYTLGRQRLLRGHLAAGYLWLSSGIVLGGLLATLSKETGVLLPLYALVMEATLFSALPRPRYWRVWGAAFLYLPLLLLLGYFALRFQSWILPGYQVRNFGPGERLLTEARILVDYLGEIIYPRPRTLGLFHDDYPISRGLLAPPQTAAALALIAVLLAAAVTLRKRIPVFSFAVLWFFSGHILESTAIPLELYFEHRNYLPLVGVLFALAYYGIELWRHPAASNLKLPLVACGLAGLGLLGAVTWKESTLWGNPLSQAVVWAEERPQSKRAQENLGNVFAKMGEYRNAAEVYAQLAEIAPREGSGDLLWLHLGCFDDKLALPDRGVLLAALADGTFSQGPVGALEQIVRAREEGGCRRLEYPDLLNMFDALLRNPNYAIRRTDLYTLRARLAMNEGHMDVALGSLDEAYRLQPRVEIALLHVKWMSEAGRYTDAQHWIEQARHVNGANPVTARRVHESEIRDWQDALSALRHNP